MSEQEVAFSPAIRPALDPAFSPAVLANRQYRRKVNRENNAESFRIALERENGLVTRGDVQVLPPASGDQENTFQYLERHIKFLLWSRGGWRLFLNGPQQYCDRLKACFQTGGSRAFDANMMSRVYARAFTVDVVSSAEIPAAQEDSSALGGHFNGCRIGFDLGASDYKLAAVREGEPVFSTEINWDPVSQTDPAYHTGHIREGIRQAAAHLPQVDAIGGSAAGIYIDNEPKVASLFRSVPQEAF